MFHVGLCLAGSWFRFYRQMYMYIYYSSDFRESWGSSSIHPENLGFYTFRMLPCHHQQGR